MFVVTKYLIGEESQLTELKAITFAVITLVWLVGSISLFALSYSNVVDLIASQESLTTKTNENMELLIQCLQSVTSISANELS